MVMVDNKETIRSLTKRFLKTYKKNTLAVLLTLSLIITLIVSLFTLIHTNHRIQAEQNLFIYTDIDCQIKELTKKQLQHLSDNRQIEKLAINRYQERIQTPDNQAGNIVAANDNSILAVSKLLQGRMPRAGLGACEIVAEKWALLNLGINPVTGTSFTLQTVPDHSEAGGEITCKIVGIIQDMTLNKLSGSINLYTGLGDIAADDYQAELKFREGTDISKEIKKIRKELAVPEKSVSINPWKEDTSELFLIDIRLGLLLLLLCAVILWGIYRISLMARESQYGILRAVGLTKRQITQMILSELFQLYFLSIPIGAAGGILSAQLVTFLSRDRELKIFFWGEEETFKMVFPVVPIILCIAGAGAVLFQVGWLGSRKVNRQSIMNSILGTGEQGGKNISAFAVPEKKDTSFSYRRLGCRYLFCNPATTFLILLSLTAGGCLFYGLAYRADLKAAENTVRTEENFYNSDYILTSSHDMDALKGITEDTLQQVRKIPGVGSTESQMAIPVKVLDNGIKRIEEYLDSRNETAEKIYGFPLQNIQGEDAVYHTKLKGYNTEALKSLRHYLVEGDFQPEGLGEDEIIIAMPRMSEYGKSRGAVGFFQKGRAIMDYQVGEQVSLKYRTDLDTGSDAYWNCTDEKENYTEREYKITAIVYYPYMKQVSVLEQVYPLFITSEENLSRAVPEKVYETVNVHIQDSLTIKRQHEIERELICLAVKNQEVTARSLIEEKAKLDMMYQKELVYIYGLACVAFILVLMNLVNSLKYRMQIRKGELSIYRAIGMDFKYQSNMMAFENMVFGILSLCMVFPASHAIARYLYTDSGIYIYGVSYEYSGQTFILLAFGILLICGSVARHLNRQMKQKNILEELNKID